MIDIEVLGLPLVLGNLSRIGAEIASDTSSVAAAGEQLRDAWVSNIESEGLVDTGRYRDSITLTVEGGHATVHTEVPYAPLLEHGTSRMAAHPVAQQALDEGAEEATNAAADALGGKLK